MAGCREEDSPDIQVSGQLGLQEGCQKLVWSGQLLPKAPVVKQVAESAQGNSSQRAAPFIYFHGTVIRTSSVIPRFLFANAVLREAAQ